MPSPGRAHARQARRAAADARPGGPAAAPAASARAIRSLTRVRLSRDFPSRTDASLRRTWRPFTPAASSNSWRRSSGRSESAASTVPCPTTTSSFAPSRPSPRSPTTSRRRARAPLIRYSPSPDRYARRPMETSAKSIGSQPSPLSRVRIASAMPRPLRCSEPAKMTSSARRVRSDRLDCSPSTQRTASAMLLLPDPLGPITALTPGSKTNRVGSAKDLKPWSRSSFRRLMRPESVRR